MVDVCRRCGAEERADDHRQGLLLAGTVLAKMGRDRDGPPGLAIDGEEERILALLALA